MGSRVSLRRPARRAAAAFSLVLALGLALNACSTPDESGSMAHRVSAWVKGTGFQAAAAALSQDVSAVQKDRRDASAAVVKVDCLTLGQDTTQDHSVLPTPDQALTLDLSKAYDAYYSYATTCVAHDAAPATLAGIEHYLATGTKAMASAQARRASLTG